MNRWKVWSVVLLVVFVGVLGAGADEPELDPLLKLLVKRGLITMEEALAVQAEYDRDRAAEQAPAAPPQEIATAPSVTPAEEKVTTEDAEEWYDRFDFRGDLRLRAEVFWVEGISPNDRRERFRARIRPHFGHESRRFESDSHRLARLLNPKFTRAPIFAFQFSAIKLRGGTDDAGDDAQPLRQGRHIVVDDLP